MATCIVTGASGLLGRAVMAELTKDFEVTGLGFRNAGGLRIADVREESQVRELVREIRPDIVLHLAAYRDPDFCEDHAEETRRLNVDPVAFFARHLPASARILVASTDYVFDGLKPPYVETDPRNPISEYGRSKCAAEDVLAGRPNSIALRIPLLIGAGATWAESGFITQLVNGLQARKPEAADDVLVRFPCWVGDVAAGIGFLVRGGHAGTFHLSGPSAGTRYDWIKRTAARLGLTHDHVTPSKTVIPRKAGRPPNSHLSDAKIRALGFKQATDPVDVIQRVARQFGKVA